MVTWNVHLYHNEALAYPWVGFPRALNDWSLTSSVTTNMRSIFVDEPLIMSINMWWSNVTWYFATRQWVLIFRIIYGKPMYGMVHSITRAHTHTHMHTTTNICIQMFSHQYQINNTFETPVGSFNFDAIHISTKPYLQNKFLTQSRKYSILIVQNLNTNVYTKHIDTSFNRTQPSPASFLSMRSVTRSYSLSLALFLLLLFLSLTRLLTCRKFSNVTVLIRHRPNIAHSIRENAE